MKLNKILIKLGISADKLGFNYIIAAINFLTKQEIHTNTMTIYEELCKAENARSKTAVERAIRCSIKQAYKNNIILQRIYTNIPDNSAFLYDLAFNLDVFIDEIEKQDNDYWGKSLKNSKYLGPKINEIERAIIDINPTHF